MNPEKYYLVDGDHMHGPMSWDELRALLEGGTVGVDAQWCREGETEGRPLSDLMALATAATMAAPPPTLVPVQHAPAYIQAAPPPVVVHVHAPARSTTAARVQAGAVATIAAVIAGPVVLSIIGSVLLALVVVFAMLVSSGSSNSAAKAPASPPAAEQPADATAGAGAR